MIKKILTTKPHLVVFFLGLLNWSLTYLIWMRIGTWNLNRTIGWGWDMRKFIYWISDSYYFINIWILLFPIIYWMLRLKKYEFNFILMILQVVVILFYIVASVEFLYQFAYSFLIANWLLFFANVIAAFYSKKR